MTQTEKPQTIAGKKQQGIVGKSKNPKIEESKKMTVQQKEKIEKIEKKPEEKEIRKEEKKKSLVKKVKKEEVSVNIKNAHISAKKSFAICHFIKGKTIEKALNDLQKVLDKKIAIPMKGEIPHKKSVKGVASGGGRYPQKTTEEFIRMIKSLQANANNHDVEEPIIVEAIANFGSKVVGRFGIWERKRAHIKIIARSKLKNKEEKKKNGRKKNSSI